MSLYFDLMKDGSKTATVSIRKISGGFWVYEITDERGSKKRDTLEHDVDGASDLDVLQAVLFHRSQPKPYREAIE